MPKPVQDRSKLRWTLNPKDGKQSSIAKRQLTKSDASTSDNSDGNSDDQDEESVDEEQKSASDSMDEMSDAGENEPGEGTSKKTSSMSCNANL